MPKSFQNRRNCRHATSATWIGGNWSMLNTASNLERNARSNFAALASTSRLRPTQVDDDIDPTSSYSDRSASTPVLLVPKKTVPLKSTSFPELFSRHVAVSSIPNRQSKI